jgi:adenylate cyclase
VFWAPLGGPLERWSYDLAFQFISLHHSSNVVVIYIDEKSHVDLGQQFNTPWKRRLHTELVKRLTEDHASIIYFDVAFSDPDPLEDDDFARAISNHGRVFLGATMMNSDSLGVLNPKLKSAAAGCGPFYFDQKDSLYGVRRIWTGTTQFPSEVWLAAKSVTPRLKEQDRLQERWLQYYGDPGTLPWVSYSDALDKKITGTGYFSNKFVFIGGRLPVDYIGAYRDQFLTPYSHYSRGAWQLAPGVEIHATSFLNLWANHFLTRLPIVVEAGILLFVGFTLGFGLIRLRPAFAFITSIVCTAVICCIAFWLIVNRIWFSWLHIALLQIPLALMISISWNAIRAHVDKKLLVESLSFYFSPARVNQILEHPEMLKPGAKRQEVSILFSDIQSFSSVVEAKNPDDMVRLLNAYYESALKCIHETEGTVMDLIGDAIFAMWNAPNSQPDHRERACRAGILLQQTLLRFDASQRDLPLQTRIGLHTGEVCVGNIGSSTRFDYTAVGPAVNIGSRLEGLNEHLGTGMLASRGIQGAVENIFTSRLIGYFIFQGMFAPTEVYELIGSKDKEAETAIWREAFANGLTYFQRKKFVEAENEFRRALDINPKDGVASFYIRRMAFLRSQQLPDSWKGEVTLDEK